MSVPQRFRLYGAILGLLAALLAAGAFPTAGHSQETLYPVDLPQVQIGGFRTPVLSAEPGRVQNIALAVGKINGVVLQPGEAFSFNDLVGPRDAEHGWAEAYEIYQGEFVRGYGGGICQVTSTLYNAVLLAGLEILERYHHDRPLEYVSPGRDATVVWNQLDFRFRNNLDRPLLLEAQILPEQPQQIEVRVQMEQGAERAESIAIEADDIKYLPPPLLELLDDRLPRGQRLVVDEGLSGIEVKIYRVFRSGQSLRRELVSQDRYEPKPGRVRVGVGNGPEVDRLLDPGMR